VPYVFPHVVSYFTGGWRGNPVANGGGAIWHNVQFSEANSQAAADEEEEGEECLEDKRERDPAQTFARREGKTNQRRQPARRDPKELVIKAKSLKS